MYKNRFFSLFISVTLIFCGDGSLAYGSNKAQTLHFITLADIHFDPFISCSHQTIPCGVIQKLRSSPVGEWRKILNQSDNASPSQYGQDTNYYLLNSTLMVAKKIADENNARFVLVLGDVIGHKYRSYYKKYSLDYSYAGYHSFLKKTFDFLNQQLNETFPNTDVYMLLGNNDSYYGDYAVNNKGSLFEDLSFAWSDLIKDKTNQLVMQKQFSRDGFYAVTLPGQPMLRLIILNTNFFSNKAHGDKIDQVAMNQLTWLHQELEAAKKNQQKVIVAMHIPPYIGVYLSSHIQLFILTYLWKMPYVEKFQIELQKFSSEIAAVFSGHLHINWSHVERFNYADNISMVGVPSISPIFGNRPEIKVFSYSTNLKYLEQMSFVYSLNKKNSWKTTGIFEKI